MGLFAQNLSDDDVFKGGSGIFLALLDLDSEHRQNVDQLVRAVGQIDVFPQPFYAYLHVPLAN